MRKTTKMKLSAILGAAAFLFVGGAFLATNETKATAEDATPTLTFKAGNVNFGDDVHTLFAVDAQNVGEAEVKVLLWNSVQAEYTVGTEDIILDDQGTVDINETTCLKYTYEGLGAHEMTKNLYARAYAVVDGVACYSDPLKYSVLQYAYNKMGKTDATASTNQDYIDLLQAMLNYGGAVQTYTNQNTDRLANADYTYVKLTNAKFEDGFTKGLYLPGEEVKIIPDDGYKLSINAGSAFEDNGNGTATLMVPENNVTSEDLFVEEGTVETLPEGESVTTTYTFADYPAGVQYAENEEHVLDENVTITTTDCHFTSELRIYSSTTNNGVAIIQSSNVIETFAFKAGNNADTLNVYGSKNGEEWTLIEGVSTSTSYKDYTVEVGGGNWYQYLKLDVAGSQQIRVKSITLTTKPLTDTEKAEKIAQAFALDATSMDGGSTMTLPEESGNATIGWALAKHANAELVGGNVLTTTNPNENTTLTLTATFTVGEATATKEVSIALLHKEEGSGGEEPNPGEPALLATFNLGANGEAAHKDGSSAQATYTETVDGYTLNITGGSKMYPSSYDATGNSCIKFGSSSAAGGFTFTVPDNVTKVVLCLAGYKDNTAKVTINGGATQTISTLSDNGEYTAIEVDTTTNKTITFTTVSGGYRAMLNTIEFWA